MVAFNHQAFAPVRRFVEGCVTYGCAEKDFDILACTTPAEAAKLLRDKLDIMKEEYTELSDAINEAATSLENGDTASLDHVTEIFDGLLDVAYVAVFMSVVLNLPFAEGFSRVCQNNQAKLQGDARVVNGKLKKPSNHVPVELSTLCVNKWGSHAAV